MSITIPVPVSMANIGHKEFLPKYDLCIIPTYYKDDFKFN